MLLKLIVSAVLISAATAAFAAPKDYTFKPVTAAIGKGDGVVLSIRLTKSGKPVSGAEIVKPEISMTPDGMADMKSPVALVPSKEPGVYSFKTDLSMTGRWLLIFSAKVPDEPDAIPGKIEFRAK